MDFGRAGLELRGRIGLADLEPNVEASLTRTTFGTSLRLAGYHRLAAANPEMRPFGVINSMTALLAGRDDGEYFRASGAEILWRPGLTRGQWFEARLYAERQRAAAVQTRASLPRLFDADQAFRPNIAAAAAAAAGAALTLRGVRPLGAHAQAGGETVVEGVGGDYRYARLATTVRASALLWRLAVGIEGGAGTSRGTVPVQGRWYLGGPATLRGYSGGAASGEAFWRARGEIANSFPAARLALFTDWGWAGPRSAFAGTRPLRAFGVGVSLLDGLIRLDVARGLRGPGGWRFDVAVDGVL